MTRFHRLAIALAAAGSVVVLSTAWAGQAAPPKTRIYSDHAHGELPLPPPYAALAEKLGVEIVSHQTPITAEALKGYRLVMLRAPSQEITADEAKAQLQKLPGWRLTHDGQRIRKDWAVKNFMAGMRFFNQCAELAEKDGHHPDLHVEGYRNLSVELWTHAIGGLSENDFILAAKIDRLPIELKG